MVDQYTQTVRDIHISKLLELSVTPCDFDIKVNERFVTKRNEEDEAFKCEKVKSVYNLSHKELSTWTRG